MRQFNATIPHKEPFPNDDRPDYLMGDYILAVDTETKGNGNWYDGPENGAFLATVSDYDRDWVYRLEGGHAHMDIHNFQEAIWAAKTMIFHNASYDIHHMVASGWFSLDELLEKKIHDTERLARLTIGLNQTPNFRLKSLGKMFVGDQADLHEHEIREAMVSLGLIQKIEQKEIPDGAFYDVWVAYPDLLEQYALNDTRITYDLFYTLWPKLEADEKAMSMYELETDVATELMRMEHRGTAVNPAKVAELHDRYTVELAACLDRLREANGGDDLDPNKRSHILPFLQKKGVELTDLTDTGEIRVDKWVLERHAGTVPEIETILEARVYEKFLSTYIERLMDRDTAHPSFRPMQARTGRMSCANPNMQNIPVRSGPEVREMFVPREGYKLVVADYSSIELRVLAHYMAADFLWDVIDAGDPFVWLGTEVFGTSDMEQWPVPRQPLKNGFYALMYGAGGPKLASTIGGGMTPQEGRDLAKKIKATLGKPYYDLIKRAKTAVRKRGFLYTMGGRPLWLPNDDYGRPKDYLALNSLIQGSAADLMKVGLVDTADAIRKYDAHILLTVHDEIVAEAPEEAAEAVLTEMKTCMAASERICNRGRLELKVEGVVCDNYGSAK